VVLAVDPSGAPGSVATLSVVSDGLPAGALGGAVAWWRCWNGTEQVDTHLIGRSWGAIQPTTIAVGPEPTVASGGIGLPVPNPYPVVIPDVAPGSYRIRDRVVMPGSEPIVGFVLVEVVSDHSTGEAGTVGDGSQATIATVSTTPEPIAHDLALTPTGPGVPASDWWSEVWWSWGLAEPAE